MNTPVKTFRDLTTWQDAKKLVVAIYEATATFPTEEKFGLISQMRRSAVSIAGNIAEGFGRISIKEKLNFYNQAHGSLTELQSHLSISMDLKFISKANAEGLLSVIQNCQASLQGLIKSTRARLTILSENR
jgi:four helix bundle protein